ncbi:MAG: N-acetylglucosamine-6-phosphate deacetylase [Actinobacteria bacterium]|nr:N-acetylglucosamine-6-phosphate deacetylase [Actinomycetota bacterium]
MSTKYWFPKAVIGENLEENVLVEVVGGKITEIQCDVEPTTGDLVINGVALPGFIDTHCHGGNGYFFSDSEVENLESIAEFHLQKGTTTLFASLVTQEPSFLLEQVERLGSHIPFLTVTGIHLEGPWLSEKYCGAHDISALRKPEKSEMEELILTSNNTILSVTIAPEIEGALEAIKLLVGKGIVVALGHTDADAKITREAIDSGASVITHFYSAMRPISHRVSSLALEALYDKDVFLEFILDGTHIIPEAIQLLLDTARHKLIAVTDAISAAGSSDGEIQLGNIAVVVKDGVAKIKNSELLAGSTLTMDRAFKFLMQNFDVSYIEAAKFFAGNAAMKYELPEVGTLEPGNLANIVVVDLNHEIEAVFFRGSRVR